MRPSPAARIRLSPAAHRSIFFAALLLVAVLVFVAAGMERADKARHLSYYEQYEEANGLFLSQQFEAAYDIFQSLAPVYPNAYILELKMSVCAMNLDMMDKAAEHSLRVLKMYPLLARDIDFIDGLAYALDAIGDSETARYVEDYYYNFAAQEAQEPQEMLQPQEQQTQ